MTHTFAILEISAAAYDEIYKLLEDAGYQHTFMEDGTIDMHGIGLSKERELMIYQSVNPSAIVTCECGYSGEAREFGATGKVEDRHEKCHCPKCQSILLEIEP